MFHIISKSISTLVGKRIS